MWFAGHTGKDAQDSSAAAVAVAAGSALSALAAAAAPGAPSGALPAGAVRWRHGSCDMDAWYKLPPSPGMKGWRGRNPRGRHPNPGAPRNPPRGLKNYIYIYIYGGG